MYTTPAVARNGPEQRDGGPLSRPMLCPQEDRTPGRMAPKPPSTWKLQIQGPSVLESKVKALKEKMAARKQGANPCPAVYEHPPPTKSKGHQVKPEAVWSLPEGSPLQDALVTPHAQNKIDGQLDSSVCVNEKKTARNGRSRPSTPDLESWNEQSLWSPEAVWMLADREDSPAPGSGSLQESSNNQVSVGQPQGPGLCKTTHLSSRKKRKPYTLGDGVITEEDLDSTALTTREDLVPRTDLPEVLRRAGGLEVLGTGANALSLSDQVEKNRLLLQEMLKVSRQSPPKVGSPDWTPSWDRAASERPTGDVDWDSGTPLQDSGQSRTWFKGAVSLILAVPSSSPTHMEGSRNGQRSPALDVRNISASRESLQNGNLSDASNVESGNGQWPNQGMPLSHVRFEDESAHEAEFRYLDRLQHRQRQVLSTVLHAVGQGPLRSKPDLTNYINRNMGTTSFHRPVGSLDHNNFSAPPSTWGNGRKCPACGSCLEERCPAKVRTAPDLKALQGLQVACEAEALLLGSCSSHDLSSPFPGLHTEWIRETHITDTVATHPEEENSVLNSTNSSDSWTDSKDARTSQPSRAGGKTQGSIPQHDSRPKEGSRLSRKAEVELPWGLQALPHLHEIGDVVASGEIKGTTGHIPQGTLFVKEDAAPKPALEPKRPWSQGQLGPRLGNHWAHPEDSRIPSRTAYAVSSSKKLGSLGSDQTDQVTESHKSLETVCLPQSHEEPSAPHAALLPTLPPSPEGWVSTPPSSRKSLCPMRKSAWTGHHGQEHQVEHMDIPLPLFSPRTLVLTPPQSQSPRVKHPLLDMSTNSYNSSVPLGQQEPWRAAVHKNRADEDRCCQEPGLPLENNEDGPLQDSVRSADVAAVNSTAVTLSLASEEPECSSELGEGLHRTESSSGSHMPTGVSPEASAGYTPPSAAHSDGNKKRKSITSTLGLKKLFSALGHSPRPRLGTSRSYSVEQLQPSALAPHTSTSKVKRAPSLQILHLVSPSHQHRKATSFQNLHSLLGGKGDRSSLYLVEGSEDPSIPNRPAQTFPHRALSVEDVGAPSLARTVGRVVEVFPDGTNQLQLQRPPEGTFGFSVAYGNGRRDSGLYVKSMADLDTAKLYSGLLGVGDEILEVNGAKVAGLGLAHIKELLAHVECLSIRVLRQRPVPQ
ncbi:4Fe-4S ferredoxin, iron-sulpur binding domain containing [Sigmodon hispidus]